MDGYFSKKFEPWDEKLQGSKKFPDIEGGFTRVVSFELIEY